MPRRDQWLTVSEVASLAGIDPRNVRKAIEKGGHWRGTLLEVRPAKGRGGKAGTSHEVLATSLPADLQERFNASRKAVQLALPLADGDGRELAWMLHYIRPIADLPSGAQRKAAIRDLDGKQVHDWNGGLVTLRRTTLYTWVKDYSDKGAAGLLRKKRADAGKPKVFVSRAWDRAVPFNDEVEQIIANALLYRIRGIWAEGHKISKVKLFSESYLQQVTEERCGFRRSRPDPR